MYSALIVAAGGGTRMHLSYNKIFCAIRGKAMLLYSIDAFRADPDFDEIVIVHAPNEESEVKKLLGDRSVRLVPGGASRQESVRNGLEAINNPIVFIQPNTSSTRLRSRWLIAYPACRVVRSSIALDRRVVFCATWGVTP